MMEQKFPALKVSYTSKVFNKAYQVYRNIRQRLNDMAPTTIILPDNVNCAESHYWMANSNSELENKLKGDKVWN